MKVSLVLLSFLATSDVSAHDIRGRSLQAFGMPCNVGDDAFCGGGCACDPGNVKPVDEGGFCHDPEVDYDGCCVCMGGGMPLPVNEPTEGEGTVGGVGGDVDEIVEDTTASTSTSCQITPEETFGCGGGEFCMLDAGACNTKIAVHEGACTAVPEVCITLVSPVCGCDQCAAHAEGVSVLRDGPCDTATIAPLGASYCTYSPDATCYQSGHPNCCAEPGTCPEARPSCEIEETSDPEKSTSMADTSSVECNEDGYEDMVFFNDDGETLYEICAFTDGLACGTWAYYPCNKTESFESRCTKGGGSLNTVSSINPSAKFQTCDLPEFGCFLNGCVDATTTGSTVASADPEATTAAPPDDGGADVDESMEPASFDSSAGVSALPISVAAGACLLIMLVP